jgi:hypothetical protein
MSEDPLSEYKPLSESLFRMILIGAFGAGVVLAGLLTL